MKKGDRIRVALVEDNVDLRETVVQMLGEDGRIDFVGVYGDGRSAIAGLLTSNAEVVLVDINLPGASGIDVIAQVKAERSDLQFLVLTVYDDADRIFRALAAGASGYLLKRDAPLKLLEAIREVRNGESPMSGSVARQVVRFFHRKEIARRETENLSPRENEILALLADGYLYKEIAAQLGIGLETVRTHIHHIYDKLHVRTRTEAVVKHLGGR